MIKVRMPEKTANISWRHHWFPHKMMSEEQVQKFHTDDERSASNWLSQEENLLQPIKSSFQIWVVTSSVWNFCTCSSEVILQGNHSIDCFLRLDTDFVVSFSSFLSLVITLFLL